jgi:hypothetical protein
MLILFSLSHVKQKTVLFGVDSRKYVTLCIAANTNDNAPSNSSQLSSPLFEIHFTRDTGFKSSKPV